MTSQKCRPKTLGRIVNKCAFNSMHVFSSQNPVKKNYSDRIRHEFGNSVQVRRIIFFNSIQINILNCQKYIYECHNKVFQRFMHVFTHSVKIRFEYGKSLRHVVYEPNSVSKLKRLCDTSPATRMLFENCNSMPSRTLLAVDLLHFYENNLFTSAYL